MAAKEDVIAAARDYFARGYQVVAIGQGKRPLGQGWRRIHTLDEVISLLEGPAIAIGFLGGELNHNIVPIDFDTPEGDAWFRTQCEKTGIDADSFPTVATPGKVKPGDLRRPGLHRYVTDVRGTLGNATGPLLASLGIDVRGRGHAMLPPSPHPDGGTYQWWLSHNLLTDFPHGVPPCPLFVYEAIESGRSSQEGQEWPPGGPGEAHKGNGGDPAAGAQFRAEAPHGPSQAGAGASSRAQAYCRAALEGAKARLAGALAGQRNAALNNEALGLGHYAHLGVYGEGEALSALMAACQENGLLDDDGIKACHATFFSGWRKGLSEPKELPEDEPARPHFGEKSKAGGQERQDWSGDSADYSGEQQKQAQKDTSSQPEVPEIDVWCDDDEPISPRKWLLGNIFCREYLSGLLAVGATGKTALRIAQALELASGKSITGEHIFQRCHVLYVCLEDSRDELKRRVRAARKHHGITAAEIDGWLYLSTPAKLGLKLAGIERGQILPGYLYPALERLIRRLAIDVVILDPFVKTHAVEENSNTQIDFVATMLANMAENLSISVDTPHHVGKAKTDPGNAESGRGASAHKDAGRLVYTLATMNPEEAEIFGIPEAERRLYVRMDSAKVNILPPAAGAKWFKLASVRLENSTETYPHGDEVQTIEAWKPPGLWGTITTAQARQILLAIDKGLSDGRRYSDSPTAGEHLAAWAVVQGFLPGQNKKQCRAIIKGWLSSGVLIKKDYHNPVSRENAQGLYVVRSKLPSGEVPD